MGEALLPLRELYAGTLFFVSHSPGQVKELCSRAVWLERVLNVYHNTIWLNPQPEALWDYHESIRVTRELMGDRMFPLTLDGLDRGMRLLSKNR